MSTQTTELTFYSDTNKEITLVLNSEGKVIGVEVFFFSPRNLSEFFNESRVAFGVLRNPNASTSQPPPALRRITSSVEAGPPAMHTVRTRGGVAVTKPCCG